MNAGSELGCGEKTEAIEASAAEANRPANFDRTKLRIAPSNSYVISRVGLQMVRYPVALRLVCSSPETDLAPFQFGMIRRARRES